MDMLGAEKYLGLIAVGIGVGTYGSLIGAGGGFVLMPLLLLLYPGQKPEQLTSISLAVVFFNALSGSEAYATMKRIDYRSGLLFSLAAIPGAVIGAIYTSVVPRRLFDVIFGLSLSAAAVFLVWRPRPTHTEFETPSPMHHTTKRNLVDAHGIRYNYCFNPLVGILLSGLVGYISSFLGIGGGIIHVPALSYLLHFPIHIATATSHFILAIMALSGTVVHILTGSFSQGVHRTIALCIGVVLGAQIGAHLSERVQGVLILRSLAVALGLVGIRILLPSLEKLIH